MLQCRPDPRLLNVWADLRDLSNAANRAAGTGAKIPARYFSRLNTSVPYRLIRLDYNPTSLEEVLRSCMLGYMKILVVKIHGIGKKMVFLAARIKTALLAQQVPPSVEHARLLFWALIVSRLSVFEDFDHDWLRACLVETCCVLGLKTWDEARAILKEHLWIDTVFDQPASQVFEEWYISHIDIHRTVSRE